MERRTTDDLSSLLDILPPEVTQVLGQINRYDELLEVILDLGRVPTARFTDGEYNLLDREVTPEDLDLVVMQVGDFDADNRAGIERTLHRISGIRNRRGEVVGLTCRIGRAVFGTIAIIQDIVESGKSILILGKPGVGKTTMLREAARVLAETKRVVIVDTSNEIGGDGDIPHPAVGKARRMQVPTPSLQHEVMIEAVENHNPEVIIIDEIGRELEAQAARTIAERGVQLIGTAHGINLENLLLNPTLSDLVGGIESVTLSDEEARRRGTQKTVLERRAPPTFDVLIELQDRNNLHVHHDVMLAVDMLLRGRPLPPEIRSRSASGEISIQAAPQPPAPPQQGNGKKGKRSDKQAEQDREPQQWVTPPAAAPVPNGAAETEGNGEAKGKNGNPPRMQSVYPYGIARNRLIESARRFKLPLTVVDSLDEANVLVTLKNFYRRRPKLVAEAENHGVSIYVLRTNTVSQIEDFLMDLFDMEIQGQGGLVDRAMREVHEGIEAVMGGADSIDLSPQKASIRRQQHELVRQANLVSHSYGKEPERHIRIYR
jgi:stage III sporulation protein SpoIIIAA